MLGHLILKELSVYLERKTYAPRVTVPSVQINTGALPLGAQESWRKVLTQSKNKAERESRRRGGNAWDNLNRWEVGPSRCSWSGESIVLCVGLCGGGQPLRAGWAEGCIPPSDCPKIRLESYAEARFYIAVWLVRTWKILTMKEIVEREARWHSYIYICELQIHHLVAVSSGQGQGTHRWTRWGKGTQESKWGCRHRSSLRLTAGIN